MAISNKFEPYAGFRFYKGGVSILLHASARFKQNATVTNLDMLKFFQRLNRLLQDIGAYKPEQMGKSSLMTADNFLDFKDVAFYKFLPEKSLQYYLEGSFQFGAIQYYRTIEQQNSKDGMEGLSNLAIKTPKHLFGMSLAAGYNFGIFCGTSDLTRCCEMSERFWPRIIKIANLLGFAEEIQSLLGAKRFYFNHVIYNDLKMFRVKTLKSINLSQPGDPNRNFDPQAINDATFDLLYDNSFLPSLFMKPTRFSVEQELRLVFEMAEDVPQVLRIADKGLLKYIEIIR